MSGRGIAKTRAARGIATLALGAGLLLAAGAAADDAPEAAGDRITRRALIERWAEASPAERKAMRSRLRERWADATPRQKRRFARGLRRLERALPDFTSIERLILLRVFADLPRNERQALRERLAALDDMPAAEREATIASLREMVESYDGEVRRLERNARRWQGMSEDERDVYRSQMERWRALSDTEREALLEEMERRRRAGGEDDDDERGH